VLDVCDDIRPVANSLAAEGNTVRVYQNWPGLIVHLYQSPADLKKIARELKVPDHDDQLVWSTAATGRPARQLCFFVEEPNFPLQAGFGGRLEKFQTEVHICTPA
jgi:hypothetical protein